LSAVGYESQIDGLLVAHKGILSGTRCFFGSFKYLLWSYLVYLPVFKSAQLASKSTSSFLMDVEKAGDITHDTFCRN